MSNKIEFQLELEKTIKGINLIGNDKLWNHLVELTSRGKKLRSSFVTLLWDVCLPQQEIPLLLINDLIALELIHTSTLIHDDIIDKGLYRRNLTTINNEFGDEIALLTGNILKDLALKLSTPQNAIVLNAASIDVNLGQLWETLAREHETISINHYFSIILFKTSKIFTHALNILSSYNKITLTDLEKNFVVGMAMVYQIADDLIDQLNSKQDDKTIGQDKKNNVHSFLYASFNADLDNVAYKDGVFYTDEIYFFRKYIDTVRNSYNFSFKIVELTAEEQVNFLKDLCELLKFEAKKEKINDGTFQVLSIYFEKILASISHLQLQESWTQ